MSIDWESESNLILSNPRTPREELERLNTISGVDSMRGHCFIAASGTSKQLGSELIWVALAKSAILASAKAVNEALSARAGDSWLLALPDYHIGGLAVLARAHLSGSFVFRTSSKWNVTGFIQDCLKFKPSFCSLVPTQIYDLVAAELRAPESLREVLVGGGGIDQHLFSLALNLGWPMSVTYGMTETASQVAKSQVGSTDLLLLPHVQAKLCNNNFCFKGSSLFSAYVSSAGINDPKVDGWFQTTDSGKLESTSGGLRLTFSGRDSDVIKVGGAKVSLSRLDSILHRCLIKQGHSMDAAVVPIPDSRLEACIGLALFGANRQLSEVNLKKLCDDFSSSVLPYERIRSIHRVNDFSRTEMGKLKRSDLLALVLKDLGS